MSSDGDNGAIQQLRNHIASLEKDLAESKKLETKNNELAQTVKELTDKLTEATGQLKEIENANLSEVERLKKENDELKAKIEPSKQLQESNEKLSKFMTDLIDKEIQSIPKDKQESIKGFLTSTDPLTNFQLLQNAKTLIGEKQGVPPVVTPSTEDLPPGVAGDPAKRSLYEKYQKGNWGDTFKKLSEFEKQK